MDGGKIVYVQGLVGVRRGDGTRAEPGHRRIREDAASLRLYGKARGQIEVSCQ